MQKLSDLIETKKETIILEGFDPISAHGFTQVPNILLVDKTLSLGAKFCYALLLKYAWQKDSCFPGQETLAEDIGVTRKTIYRFLKELKKVGFLKTIRRGLGKTNVYILRCKVRKPSKR